MSREIVKQYETPPSTFNPLEGHPDPEQLTLDSLRQGTLLAGREKPLTWELDEITSEGALHRYRAQAEIEALINLAERGPVDIAIDEEQKSALRSLYSSETFDPEIVIRLDHLGYKGRPPLEHDVKAVEYFLKEKIADIDAFFQHIDLLIVLAELHDFFFFDKATTAGNRGEKYRHNKED